MEWKNIVLLALILNTCCTLKSQVLEFDFEPNHSHPFGLPNPEGPEELLDWAPLIGESRCISIQRNADQSWADPVNMIWRWKYIMNGTAVQDETLKANAFYAGSIRQFIPDSNHWFVHYYSSVNPSTRLPVWEGNKQDDGEIILYRKQKAPNGLDGFYKIRFHEISNGGYKWLGAWVNTDESIVYPTWRIECQKNSPQYTIADSALLLEKMEAFSKAYMDADYDAIADAYTEDAKIFPGNTRIIEGRDAIKKQWQLPAGAKVEHHQIMPEEIYFIRDHAYDYGYYEGRTRNSENEISEWRGKYVIIWKKINGDWKMYLDIWNRVRE